MINMNIYISNEDLLYKSFCRIISKPIKIFLLTFLKMIASVFQSFYCLGRLFVNLIYLFMHFLYYKYIYEHTLLISSDQELFTFCEQQFVAFCYLLRFFS